MRDVEFDGGISSCASCHAVWAVVSDWGMGQIILGGLNGSGRLCNVFSMVRLHVGNPFWRVVLHCICMGLMETMKVYVMCVVFGGVRHVWFGEGALA